MESKDYSTLLSEMKNYMIAHSTKITDFNSGSNIMTIFESIANVVEEAYIDTRLGFNNLINQIATSVFGFSKKSGSYAGVSVKFSLANAVDYDVSVPVGTVVSDGSHNFTTSSLATISAGDTESNLAAATAEEVGIEYNIQAETINTIVSTVSSDVVAVINPSAAVGGVDEESDSEMLARFKIYINGLQGGNYYGMKAGLLALDEVRSIGIVEHFPPVVGTDNVYNVSVYVDDGSGSMSDTLKEEIVELINGDGTSLKPGLRACGINVRVLPASQIIVKVKCHCDVYRTEASIAEAAIKSALTEFINNLEIGDDVLLSDLILKIRNISYVKDVSNLQIGTSEYAAANISIDKNQIARIGDMEIEVENV